MRAFEVIGDPVRRRILDLLVEGERTAGEIGAVVQREFHISQPAVSQHLRVLRDGGLARVRSEGTRRRYAVDPAPLREVAEWVDRYLRHWTERFDSLDEHLAAVQGKARAAATPARGATRARKPK
jgi:DNA-binding transcriptional ArsR family regulator